MDFYINQKFTDIYPPEAAIWCNTRGDCSIQQVVGGYQIIQNPEPDASEIAMRVRAKRDRLIAETDYYLMPDYPSNPQNLEELKVYRQALRDLPVQEGFPKMFVGLLCLSSSVRILKPNPWASLRLGSKVVSKMFFW